MDDRTLQIARTVMASHDAGATYRNLTGDLAPRDADEAYAAQSRLHALHARDAAGRGPIGGRKIALASKVQQALCGVDHPIAGGLFEREIMRSPATVRLADHHGLGLEFELAVVVGEDMTAAGAPFTKASVRPHIREVRPAFELIIDRAADYADLDALSMIADNAWSAGVVLGESVSDWEKRDLDAIAATLFWNDEPPQHTVTGAADPLGSLAWVANLVTSQGGHIRAGETVITGSVIKTRAPEPGDRVRYEFDGLAKVEVTIA